MHAKRVTVLSIVINVTLFLLKLVAGLAANSLAILADAANSLLDTLYSIGVQWSVTESHKKADKGHPFGHARAEPMVGFVIALLMGIAAFEFVRAALFGLFAPQERYFTWLIAASLIIAIIAKILLSHEAQVAGMRTKSPALLATASDSRNDVLITMTALTGLVFAASGYPWIDNVAAIAIGLFLFAEAYRVGKANVDYLVGAAPPAELQHRIREITSSVLGVRGLQLIRAHYVGNHVHVEIHIQVNRQVSTRASHHIAMTVQHDVERLPLVSKAFVHVEPV